MYNEYQEQGRGVFSMEKECIFCKIVNRAIPAEIVYETEDVLAFMDTNLQAPVHILVIPKVHIQDFSSIELEQLDILAKIGEGIQDLASKFSLTDGYRVVNNCGEDGGQSVAHLHFHLLGGRKLGWPPG